VLLVVTRQPSEYGVSREAPFTLELTARDLPFCRQGQDGRDTDLEELGELLGRQHLGRVVDDRRSPDRQLFAERACVALDELGDHLLLRTAELERSAAELLAGRGGNTREHRHRFFGRRGKAYAPLRRHILISR
jgi:hypothetical protein